MTGQRLSAERKWPVSCNHLDTSASPSQPDKTDLPIHGPGKHGYECLTLALDAGDYLEVITSGINTPSQLQSRAQSPTKTYSWKARTSQKDGALGELSNALNVNLKGVIPRSSRFIWFSVMATPVPADSGLCRWQGNHTASACRAVR